MSDNIIVIGSGVSGVTTALTLQLLGYDTEIYTEKVPELIADKNNHSKFASLFPSASVIPHSVHSNRLKELFQHSQSFFYELRKKLFPGIVIHKHFEVFEFDPGQPEYRNWMLNLKQIDSLHPQTIPRRGDSQQLHGWVFDCLFADWALYFPALLNLYRECGGQITTHKLDHNDLSNLPADVLINCSGTGAPALFDDPSDEQLLLRGHLLYKPNAPLITNPESEIISYNYTPRASVYADAEGEPCDVYCYPRNDGWILGGSRQSKQLRDHNTANNTIAASSYEVDEISFPAPILDLNNEILSTTYGHSLELSDDLTPFIGYRYIRSRKNGLRLDSETISGKTVFHNYGHGGAGVTLSWGCALAIASQVISREIPALREELSQEIENINLSAFTDKTL